MVSTRTQYRQKRIQLITDSIKDLASLLLLSKKDLEKVHIKHFKYIAKSIEKITPIKIKTGPLKKIPLHYPKKIIEFFSTINSCELCGNNKELILHHIDGDRHNNQINNLIRVCYECHYAIHHGNIDFNRVKIVAKKHENQKNQSKNFSTP